MAKKSPKLQDKDVKIFTPEEIEKREWKKFIRAIEDSHKAIDRQRELDNVLLEYVRKNKL
jgi:hypothetical protein